MNKVIPVAVMLAAMIICPGAAAASDPEVSLGIELWSSTWKETLSSGAGSSKFNNGNALMLGPSLNVRFREHWFAGITYLEAFDDHESGDWYTDGDRMSFERTDMDLQAGYLVRDQMNDLNAGFFLTYKIIDAPASYTNEAAGLVDVGIGTWKLEGPGIGALFEKRIDGLTKLTGTIAYLLLEQEFSFTSGGASRFDASGWAFEIAVKHFFTRQISAGVGMKLQRTKGEQLDGDIVRDTFLGFTGGVAYTF